MLMWMNQQRWFESAKEQDNSGVNFLIKREDMEHGAGVLLYNTIQRHTHEANLLLLFKNWECIALTRNEASSPRLADRTG